MVTVVQMKMSGRELRIVVNICIYRIKLSFLRGGEKGEVGC
jgi:hypothetical protein